MRVLGLDLGTKTLGMAISDETMFIASGLETFHFKVRNFDLDPFLLFNTEIIS